jgi:hypothetical protein
MLLPLTCPVVPHLLRLYPRGSLTVDERLYLVTRGRLSWIACYAGGIQPALAVVPIVPFLPHRSRHVGRSIGRPRARPAGTAQAPGICPSDDHAERQRTARGKATRCGERCHESAPASAGGPAGGGPPSCPMRSRPRCPIDETIEQQHHSGGAARHTASFRTCLQVHRTGPR